MPTSKMVEQAEFKLPEETPFPAVLLSVTEKTIPFKNKQTGKDDSFTKWSWEFEITEGDYAGIKAWGDTEDRLTTHPDNKVRQWAETLLDKQFAVGEGIDTDDLLGLPCVITVDNTTYEKNNETKYICPVRDVFPAGAGVADPWATPGDEEPPF